MSEQTPIDDLIDRWAMLDLLEVLADLLRRGAVYTGTRPEGRNDENEYTSLVFKVPRRKALRDG